MLIINLYLNKNIFDSNLTYCKKKYEYLFSFSISLKDGIDCSLNSKFKLRWIALTEDHKNVAFTCDNFNLTLARAIPHQANEEQLNEIRKFTTQPDMSSIFYFNLINQSIHTVKYGLNEYHQLICC